MSSKSSKNFIFLLLLFLSHFIQFSLCGVECRFSTSGPSSSHLDIEASITTDVFVFGIIGLVVFGMFLVFCFLIAYCVNRKALNGVILSIPWTLLDFALQALFIKNQLKDNQYQLKDYYPLYITSIIFFIGPMIVNIIFSFAIILNEKKKRSTRFNKWFHNNSTLAAITTVFAGADMSTFKLLYSHIFNLNRFKAPFSEDSKTIILWGCVISSVIQDIPQLIIQVIYKVKIKDGYPLIPFLKLVTVSIKLPIGIIGRIYEALGGHDENNDNDDDNDDGDDGGNDGGGDPEK
ncbi:hypothetical protein RclHR1_04630010 [Rhizophagus clarus]|uniref:Uncharacterized protein n=1 Tax=Rhizophagus clarus TaxID=94130 RepID=A0A2Z6RJQ5_9GLOM|nr:hypothetical protein RclHR1_04630010 [Rhizophagus clarus]GET00334.1 hypothetical protein GLOIN_2v1788471 [Rhizophagus clarus]